MKAIIIARMLWGLNVPDHVKREISHCTLYNRVPSYARLEYCKEVIAAKYQIDYRGLNVGAKREPIQVGKRGRLIKKQEDKRNL